jgi:ABC-type branched-subunit amino acid transport system substrate-binding protein
MCWAGAVRLLFLATVAASTFISAHTAVATTEEDAHTRGIEIAAALCLSGDEQAYSQSALEGLQLAIADANARKDGPTITLKIYDEQSTVEGARRIAQQIADSHAPFVLGSVFSFLALVEGPIFAKAGIAALSTATSDLITRNPTTFRLQFKTSDQGEMLATYASRVLHQKRMAAISVDDGYGGTMRSGFEAAATRLGLDARYYSFKTPAEAQQAAEAVAADPARPAVALMMLDNDGARVLSTLSRRGVTSPILGGNAFGEEPFSERLAGEPEEKQRHGSLSDGLYAISPMMLDSANAETQAFATRYRDRSGRDPSGLAAEWYDAGLLAASAARSLLRDGNTDPPSLRAHALAYFQALDAPARSVPGLLGPIWFDEGRGRPQALRVGRFKGGHIDSAPLQIVPVSKPSASDVASGAVFEQAPGRFARLQRVAYAGIYVNEISHIDLPRSSFGADFYMWLRFANEAGGDSLDPSDIVFPNMVSGGFDPSRPAEQGDMPDGTIYRLWRVQGEFHNDYDLHNFPFDHQKLALTFFNARGASDRIVYVLDRQTKAGGAKASGAAADTLSTPSIATIASPAAFTELTQWEALGGEERRQNLVTNSSLGDPRRLAIEGHRELSGFIATLDVKRRALSTVIKTLMPLLLMTLIIYTTLHFPPVLIKEKVTVAITGALSGAVLLTAINSQLGSIGYTIAIEYAFFVFFGLTTLTIISALMAQHWRSVHRDHVAVATDWGTRIVFALAVIGVLAGAWWISASGGAAP